MRQRSRGGPHTAVVVLALLTATACGPGPAGRVGADGSPKCPTDEQIDQMSSEELNAIPRECDESMTPPPDMPGVRAGDGDDSNGRPIPGLVQVFDEPGVPSPGQIDRPGDHDFVGVQWPGGTMHSSVTPAGRGLRVAVVDLEGDVVSSSDGKPLEGLDEVRGALPRGRYLVSVYSLSKDPSENLLYSVTPRLVKR